MRKITLAFLLMSLSLVAFAQKSDQGYAGVYMTKENFINNRLSYKINTADKGDKLKFIPIADWTLTIRIVTPDSVQTFKRGTIYGYYENGKVYRYAPPGNLYAAEDYYRVEDDRGLVIYTSEFNGGSEYYYSTDLTAPIQLLNLKNIKRDFKSQPQFVSAVKRLNKKEVHGELAKRDSQGNFIINKIYTQSVRK